MSIPPSWHSLELNSVFNYLQSQSVGLREEIAQQRLIKYGYNRLPPPKPRRWIKRFLAQFQNVLIYISNSVSYTKNKTRTYP